MSTAMNLDSSRPGLSFLFPPPLRGRVREGGKPQTPELVVPPSPPLPHKGGESRLCFAAALLFNNP
jgi:hypothetical protein